jgi:hypothetical protein
VLKGRRHHPNDGHVHPIESHRVSDDSRITAIAIHPEAVAENRFAISPRLVFFGSEYASYQRLNPESSEEIGGGCERLQALGGFAGICQIWPSKIVCRHRLKDVALLAVSKEIPRGVWPAL